MKKKQDYRHDLCSCGNTKLKTSSVCKECSGNGSNKKESVNNYLQNLREFTDNLIKQIDVLEYFEKLYHRFPRKPKKSLSKPLKTPKKRRSQKVTDRKSTRTKKKTKKRR